MLKSYFMNRTRRFTLLALVVPVLAGISNVAQGGSLRKVWDFDATTITSAGSQRNPLEVVAVGFSPDGRQIAAVVGPSQREQWVLILRRDRHGTRRVARGPGWAQKWAQQQNGGWRPKSPTAVSI